MSNSHGLDLRPYLLQVLMKVRREWARRWKADWPHEGRVHLQFSVDCAGEILSVMIISSSGLPDIDRSVADVLTASSPFAPLPESLQSDEVTLLLKVASR